MSKIAATSALLIGTAVLGCGTANATPAADPAPVRFTAAATADGSAVVRTDAGSMRVDNGVFKIEAADGSLLAGTELSFRVDDFVFPVTADIADHTATLTPRFDLAHAAYQPIALDDGAQREALAWQRLTSTILTGAALGTATGAVGGAAIGCLAGGLIAGGGATLATGIIGGIFAFLPAAAVGCLAGAAAISALGTVGGALLVTLPVAVGAAVQYYSTINTPLPQAKPA
ncbi:hypothetical protein [Nocardia sp. NBC_00511]|uniref:hypothetical protein n=1 Tax=Nocardia sp. NBC_00511 TaxID=2903591 RepID=UPI0030E17383